MLRKQHLACSSPASWLRRDQTNDPSGSTKKGSPGSSTVGVHRVNLGLGRETRSYRNGVHGRGKTGCEPTTQAKGDVGVTGSPGTGQAWTRRPQPACPWAPTGQPRPEDRGCGHGDSLIGQRVCQVHDVRAGPRAGEPGQQGARGGLDEMLSGG